MGPMKLKTSKLIAIAIVTSVVAAACGSAAVDLESGAGSSFTEESGFEELADSSSSSTEDLIESLSPCPDSEIEWKQLPQIAERIDTWWAIDSMDNSTAVVARTSGVSFEAANVTLGSDVEKVELGVHGDLVPSIDWALRNEASVHLGTSENLAFAAAIRLNDGRTIFGGQCQHELIHGGALRMLGDDADTFFDKLTTVIGPELVALATGQDAVVVPVDDIVRLNPADVSEDTLASLQSVILFYALDKSLPNRTICSRTGAGWNDCFGTDGFVGDNGGVWIEAFVDDSGILDVYLLDSDADLSNPLFRLGTLAIPEGELRNAETLAIRIDIDTEGAIGGRVDSSITVGEMANMDDIDVEGDTYWSFALVPGQSSPVE